MSSWGDSAVRGGQRVRALVLGLVCLVVGGAAQGWEGTRRRLVWALEPPLREGLLQVRLSAFPAMSDVEEIRRQLPPYL